MNFYQRLSTAALAVLSVSLIAGENLAPNPAFEGKKGWVTLNASMDETVGHTAPGSAVFRSSDAKTRRMIHTEIKLNQEKALPIEYGAWCKTQGVPADKHACLYLAVCFKDGKKDWHAPQVVFPNKTDWTFRKKIYFPAKPVQKIILYQEFTNSPGTVWIDDLFLKEKDPKSIAEAEPAQPDGNYLENGSFSEGRSTWEFWNATLDKKVSRTDNDTSSAKFESKDEKTRRMVHTDVILNQKTAQPIVFGAWCKTKDLPSDKHAVMYIAVYFQDGKEFWQVPTIKFDNTSDWARKEQMYTPPKPVKRIHVYMEFNKSPGTVWLDDVFVNVGKAGKTEASAPCSITENPVGIAMGNAFVELQFAPSHGGACIQFKDKQSGAEFVGADPDSYMFTDRIRELGRTALFNSRFGYRILKQTPDAVSVEFLLPKLPSYPFVGLRRTITLERESAKVSVHYEFYNEAAAMTPITLTPYFRNGLIVKNETAEFYFPRSEGIFNRNNASGGEAKFTDTVQGWNAAIGASGRGLACEYDLSRIKHVYAWLSGTEQSTLEWSFLPLEIQNGKSFETNVVWFPFSGMKKIDNAENGVAGCFQKNGYEFYSSENFLATAEVVAEYSNGKRVVENKSMSFKAGKKSVLPFGFSMQDKLKSVKVSLVQNGRSCFESMKSFEKGFRYAPRSAKIPPAQVKAFKMELSEETVTPHIKWSRPYYKGAVRALVLVNVPNAREIVELMQRMEIACETVRFSDQDWEIGFWHPERYLNFTRNDANLSLADSLKKEYDVIVVSGGMWRFFTPENIAAITKKLKNGTGLVLINPDSVPKTILPFTPLASSSKNEARAFSGQDISGKDLPYAAWPVGNFSRYQFSKDAIVLAICRNIPLIVRNTSGNSVFAYSGAGTLVPELPYKERFPEYNYPDYQFQPLIKAILAAAKKSPSAKLAGLKIQDGRLHFSLEGTLPGGKITVKLMQQNLLSGAKSEKTGIPVTGKTVLLPLPAPLTPGMNVVDAILYADGKVVDFAGCTANETKPAKVSAFNADTKPLYKAGGRISGTLSVTGGNAKIELSDTWKRVIAETNAGNGAFEITIPEASSPRMYLTAKVFANGVLSDKKQLELYVFKPFLNDDFLMTIGDHTWASGRNRYFSTHGFYNQILEYGFEHLRFWVTNQHDIFKDSLRYNMFLTFPVTGARASEINEDKRLYNQTRDKKYLCRKPCLHDSEKMEKTFSGAHALIDSLKKYSPSGFDFGDENSLTAWATPFDYCFSGHTIKAFRKWLRTQYSDLASLNAEWETGFASWESVMPMTSGEILKKAKTTRNYAQWADHRLFMDITFAGFFERETEEVRKCGLDIPLDISGISEPTAYDGMDWWRFSKFLTQASFYRLKSNDDVIASFNQVRGTGWSGYGARGVGVKYAIWNDTFRFRRSGAAFYAAEGLFLNPDYSMPQATKDFLDAVKDLRFGTGRLLESLDKKNIQVLIHYSMPSIRTCDLEGRLPELIATRESWMKLLSDLNLDYQFIAYEEIEKGKLNDTSAKILILPMSTALSKTEAEKIEIFARKGGLVIGDRMTGIFNERSRLLKRGQLDSMFGLSTPDTANAGMKKVSCNGKSLNLMTGNADAILRIQPVGNGRAVFLNALLTGYSSLRKTPGKENEVQLYQSLVKSFLNGFEKPSAVTVQASELSMVRAFHYAAPRNAEAFFIGLLRENCDKDAGKIALSTKVPKHVYSVRDGKYYGKTNQTQITLSSAEAKLLAFLPHEIRGVKLQLPKNSRRGVAVPYKIQIDSQNTALDYPCVLEVYSPDGKKNLYYSRNLTVSNGVADGTVRFALNDAPGTWTVTVRDVISQKSISVRTVLSK